MTSLRKVNGKARAFPILLTKRSLGFITNFLRKQCRYLYFQTKESFGQHKRDLIVSRVEETCDSLYDTQVHFSDALDRFKALVQVEDEPLEKRYQQLKLQLDISITKATGVSDNIRLIEEVSEALFAEWETELELYNNRTLRAQSKQKLKVTRQHYARLIKAMYRAEAKINPVLAAFRDQVLFLKHNLNAHAIASLQHELAEITIDISQLIKAMEHSINEANSFVSTLVQYNKSLPNPNQI